MNALQCSADAYRDSTMLLAIPVGILLLSWAAWQFYVAPRWQVSLVAYRDKVRSQLRAYFMKRSGK